MAGFVFVIRNGLRWRDAPTAYGPAKTLYNRFVRWSRLTLAIGALVSVRPRLKGNQKRRRSRNTMEELLHSTSPTGKPRSHSGRNHSLSELFCNNLKSGR
jgi:transposase